MSTVIKKLKKLENPIQKTVSCWSPDLRMGFSTLSHVTYGYSSKNFSPMVSAPLWDRKLELLCTDMRVPFHFWLMEISFLAFNPNYVFWIYVYMSIHIYEHKFIKMFCAFPCDWKREEGFHMCLTYHFI